MAMSGMSARWIRCIVSSKMPRYSSSDKYPALIKTDNLSAASSTPRAPSYDARDGGITMYPDKFRSIGDEPYLVRLIGILRFQSCSLG